MWRWLLLLVVSGLVVAEHPDNLFDYDLYENVLDPELCRQQLRNMQPFEFYDASFRVPQGMSTFSLSSIGEYNQCLGINQQSEVGPIEGKFCMFGLSSEEVDYTLSVPLFTASSWPEHVGWSTFNLTETKNNLKKYESVITKLVHFAGADNRFNQDRSAAIFGFIQLSLALCIPKACSVSDILDPVLNNALVPLNYEPQYCRLPDDKPLSGADYAAIVILSVIGFITILSTAYDLYHIYTVKEDSANHNKLYSCFSIYTNTKRLCTFTANPGSLDCLEGMRSISILWIILGHVFAEYIVLYSSNILGLVNWVMQRRAIWLLSTDLGVDTFFTMSGLLVVYTAANKMNQRKLLTSIHWFYLNRVLRLFPLLALAVLLQASIFYHVTDGPNTHSLSWYTGMCRQYWWSTLLHVQNWVNAHELCLPHTWYLSVDVQLHFLSPLLLFWVLGSRRSAWSALTVGFVATLTASTVLNFLIDFEPESDYYQYYYYNTLTRAPPFIIGMICGYLIHCMRGKTVKMPVLLVATGYLLALVASWYAMYQKYHNFPPDASQTVIDLNLSIEKSLWTAAVCWVVFACVTGYGGPINWFLSLQLWKFTGRISYALYLFHYPIIFMHGASLTTPFHYTMENMWFTFGGVTAYTVVLSIAACVLVDAPFSTLQKTMMAGLLKAPTRKEKSSEENEHDAKLEQGS